MNFKITARCISLMQLISLYRLQSGRHREEGGTEILFYENSHMAEMTFSCFMISSRVSPSEALQAIHQVKQSVTSVQCHFVHAKDQLVTFKSQIVTRLCQIVI